MRLLLLLSGILELLSSPVLGQTTATNRIGLALSSEPSPRVPPSALTLRTQLQSSDLQRRDLASDSADTDVWRRFRMGAAAGFAIGAALGLVVQSQANQRATSGADFPPLVTAVFFGIPAAVVGGAIAARWHGRTSG